MGISKEIIQKQKIERLGIEKENTQGERMKIVKYNSVNDIVVEFQDEFKGIKFTNWSNFCSGKIANPNRILKIIGKEKVNKQGCIMKIMDYKSNSDILVQFDNKNDFVHSSYDSFLKGAIKNPYYPTIYDRGYVGQKYITSENYKNIKEYNLWYNMFIRCYDKKAQQKHGGYDDCEVCEEWYSYEKFYEWVHKQENFEQWYNNEGWDIDKDIISKGNKIYCPNNCSLVPKDVNMLFIKNKHIRGLYPIGVTYKKEDDMFLARVSNPLNGKREFLGYYNSQKDAFLAYKHRKEEIIKNVANKEFTQGNITLNCYEAMMRYEVEITD